MQAVPTRRTRTTTVLAARAAPSLLSLPVRRLPSPHAFALRLQLRTRDNTWRALVFPLKNLICHLTS